MLATCQMCGYEVEFERKNMIYDGGNCPRPDCGGKIYKKPSKFKESKLNKAYFFTHSLKCNKCKKIYVAEEYKVKRGTPKWREYEQRIVRENKKQDRLFISRDNGDGQENVLEQDNWTVSKGNDYLPAV